MRIKHWSTFFHISSTFVEGNIWGTLVLIQDNGRHLNTKSEEIWLHFPKMSTSKCWYVTGQHLPAIRLYTGGARTLRISTFCDVIDFISEHLSWVNSYGYLRSQRLLVIIAESETFARFIFTFVVFESVLLFLPGIIIVSSYIAWHRNIWVSP